MVHRNRSTSRNVSILFVLATLRRKPSSSQSLHSRNRLQMLQLVNESALSPSAVLHQHTIVHFLTAHFLSVEFLPCDVVVAILREGLERACSSSPPSAVPGVMNPVVALELLNSSQRELTHELVALSSSCTCSGAQGPLALETSSKKLLPSESSSMKAFVEEVQRISTQVHDGQSPVYVGALARAFPCLLYTSPSPRDRTRSRMPSSA